MNEKPSNHTTKNTSAGGIFVAIGPLLGAVLGGLMGQPSIGLLTGLAIGSLIATAIWLKDK